MQTPMGATVRNVNSALMEVVQLFKKPHLYRRIAPRNSDKTTLELVTPFVTVYRQPLERVLFEPKRDANPFFHALEALWILAGRDDVEWLSHVLPRMREFSDDGVAFHGAYGARARRVLVDDGEVVDQLGCAIEQLRHDPHSRRAVLSLYQPQHDAGYSGKDMPCNCTLTLKLRDGHLHMSVFNRSNDMVWGLYGANVVQFATMLEYCADMLGVPVGLLYTWSDSLHVYENEPSWQRVKDLPLAKLDPYDYSPQMYTDWLGSSKVVSHFDKPVRPYPLVTVGGIFDTELQHFMNYSRSVYMGKTNYLPEMKYENIYLDHVARPLFNSIMAWHQKRSVEAMEWAKACRADDWRLAAWLWLQRRIDAQKEAV